MAGIKETMDVLLALETTANAVLKACEDGKLSLIDLRYVLEPARAAAAALKDGYKIPLELTNLSAEETEELLGTVGEVVPKVIMAAKAVADIL
jgi:hypothetical protein